MALGFLSAGISIGFGVLGLRTLWKYQHRLKVRGYVTQAALVLIGAGLMIIGARLPNDNALGRACTISGAVLVFLFLLFPDLIYYSQKAWNKLRT